MWNSIVESPSAFESARRSYILVSSCVRLMSFSEEIVVDLVCTYEKRTLVESEGPPMSWSDV